jgi:hypothetical protein
MSMFYIELLVGLVVIILATIELIQRLRKKRSPIKSVLSYLWEIISW